MITTEEMLKVIRCYPPTGRDFKTLKVIQDKTYQYVIDVFWCGLVIRIPKFSKFSNPYNLNMKRVYCSKKFSSSSSGDIFWFLPYKPNINNIKMEELIYECLGPLLSYELALDYLDRFHSMTFNFVENFRTAIDIE